MATSGTMFCLDIQMYMTNSGGCRLHNTVLLGEHNEQSLIRTPEAVTTFHGI